MVLHLKRRNQRCTVLSTVESRRRRRIALSISDNHEVVDHIKAAEHSSMYCEMRRVMSVSNATATAYLLAQLADMRSVRGSVRMHWTSVGAFVVNEQ